MVKPTSSDSRHSKTSVNSQHSARPRLSSESISKGIMNSHKKDKRRRKSQRKQRNSIQRLLENLSSKSSLEILNDSNTSQASVNSNRVSSTNHLHCSTPKANKSKEERSLNNLNISNVSSTHLSPDSADISKDIINLTKEINADSYITIDLTKETIESTTSFKTANNTVIDLANDSAECTLVSISNGSMSDDSNVTVINLAEYQKKKKSKKLNAMKIADGIDQLNASEKGRLLEMITQKIFNGCKVPSRGTSISSIKETVNHATETVEDTYIKEVILGQTLSRNSIGSNIYNPEKDSRYKKGLRLIVIDGSNVAMEHGKGHNFSVRGLKICIDYFLRRGHTVKAFVPRFRCKFGKSTEPRLLDTLERQGLVVYTPSREIQGRMITSYDDRYIVQCAAEFEGVIVSGDNYRDLLLENPSWRRVIETRLLPFTWVNNMLMFPQDPLGRNGPKLEQFLRHPD